MFCFFRQHLTSIMGMDINALFVSVLVLSCVKNTYKVEHFGIEFLKNKNSIEDGIKNAIMNAGINHSYPAALAVSSSEAIIRIISVSQELNDNEILDHIELESNRFIPYPLEEVYFDFITMGSSKQNPKMKDVFLVVVKKEVVNSKVLLLNSIGVEVTIVDFAPFALGRILDRMKLEFPNLKANHNIAVFDIQNTSFTLYIFQNGYPIYNRSQILNNEFLKENNEIDTNRESQKMIILQILDRALQTFYLSTKEKNIEYVCLLSEIDNLLEISNSISIKFNVPVTILRSFYNMQFSNGINQKLLNKYNSIVPVTCGLALRHLNDRC